MERGFARVCALPEVYEGIVVRLDAFSPPQHCEIMYFTPSIRIFKTIGEAAPLPPATNEGVIEWEKDNSQMALIPAGSFEMGDHFKKGIHVNGQYIQWNWMPFIWMFVK